MAASEIKGIKVVIGEDTTGLQSDLNVERRNKSPW